MITADELSSAAGNRFYPVAKLLKRKGIEVVYPEKNDAPNATRPNAEAEGAEHAVEATEAEETVPTETP